MFNEANSVRDFVRDQAQERHWEFIAGRDLSRDSTNVFCPESLIAALIRLNPDIALYPDRANEVLLILQAIIVSTQSGSLIAANEEFAAWLLGERSMPFGENNEHVTIKILDLDDPSQNEQVISTEVTFSSGRLERRFDLVFWVNGIPLAIGEAKSPIRPAYSWVDAAAQVHDDYEVNVAQFFVPNVLSFATDGKEFRYGSVGMPIDIWGPWRSDQLGSPLVGLAMVKEAVLGLLDVKVILDFAKHFTAFATDNKHRKIKVIARYQQFLAGNAIVYRVLEGRFKKGLIWHFQGSGKSLLMMFAAQKLRSMRELSAPTVLIVVDRIDLDTQISATFNASDVPNVIATDSRSELQSLLKAGTRKIIITTIHKFAETEGVLDDRSNIVVLVDEAHRTQEGNLGRSMRDALPNAFMFGLTGTPINKRDRNTFYAFGEESDEGGYMSKYSFSDSIRDGATLQLHFEPRPVEFRVDQNAIDAGFEIIAEGLTEKERALLSARAAKTANLLKAADRIEKLAIDVVDHYQAKVEPNGLKGQVVLYDKETCVMFKQAIDRHLPEDASAIVMSIDARDPQAWKEKYSLDTNAEAKLLDRFRDPADPLKLLIVTAKLLTGFDAPILQAQYLDKPLREHTLLQAICRTNRPYPDKTHGLVVDYLGIFDDVAQALLFDDRSVKNVITNIVELKKQLPSAIEAALLHFIGLDRTIEGWEGLQAAQEKVPTDATRDAFALDYSLVSQLWEAISPDSILNTYEQDYKWLSAVYESVRPSDHTGRLIWHAHGQKTLELINAHVTVEVPRDDLETIILDAEVLDDLSTGGSHIYKKTKLIEIKIAARIAKHNDNPLFIELGERLEVLKTKYAEGQQASLDFLRDLLDLARETIAAEKTIALIPREEKGKAALTELFESLKTDGTPVMVERIVIDIDEVVRAVRFDGWQGTSQGDREVQQALRKTLYVKYKMRDADVFEKALEYIREYY